MPNTCPYCRNQKVLKEFNDLATTQQSLMHEWDYLDNLLIANPTEITELSNMSVWWICQENPEHRYKIQVKEWRHTESEIKRHVRFAKVTEESKNTLYSLKRYR